MAHIYKEDYEAFNNACDAHYRKLQNISTKHGIRSNKKLKHETEIEYENIEPEEELDFENNEKLLFNLRNQ